MDRADIVAGTSFGMPVLLAASALFALGLVLHGVRLLGNRRRLRALHARVTALAPRG